MEGRSGREGPAFQRELGSSFSGGMMQNIRITDVVRCLLLNVPNAPNLVCPGGALPSGRGLGRPVIWRDDREPADRTRRELAFWERDRVTGMLALHSRNGLETGRIISHPEYPGFLRAGPVPGMEA